MDCRKPLALVALAALALASGCAHRAETVEAPRLRATDYYPLAVGNEWTYVATVGPAAERTTRITGMRDGYYVDDAQGMFKVDAGGLRDDRRYMLAEPIERGRGWKSIVSVASTERYEIVETGFTVSTRAGIFKDCVQVRGTNRIDANRDLRVEWTYAPGVGIVRLATAVRDGTRVVPQTAWELKSFKLAPAASAAVP